MVLFEQNGPIWSDNLIFMNAREYFWSFMFIEIYQISRHIAPSLWEYHINWHEWFEEKKCEQQHHSELSVLILHIFQSDWPFKINKTSGTFPRLFMCHLRLKSFTEEVFLDRMIPAKDDKSSSRGPATCNLSPCLFLSFSSTPVELFDKDQPVLE